VETNTGLAILIGFALGTQLGCNPSTTGPCEHFYEEPILHIEAVTNSKTGEYLQTIILSHIFLDTISTDPRWLVGVSNNVVFLDSSLICNVPCAFGIESSRYSFKVSAAGYADTTIICDAHYSIIKGGCPSSSNGGTRISFSMRPI